VPGSEQARERERNTGVAGGHYMHTPVDLGHEYVTVLKAVPTVSAYLGSRLLCHVVVHQTESTAPPGMCAPVCHL
jgi:hypothetical protein